MSSLDVRDSIVDCVFVPWFQLVSQNCRIQVLRSEPLASVGVLHSLHKIKTNVFGQQVKLAQVATHETAQCNECMTVQPLLLCVMADHKHRCTLISTAACRSCFLFGAALAFLG